MSDAAARAQAEALKREWATLRPAIERGDVPTLTRICETVERAYAVRVVVTPCVDVGASYDPRTRLSIVQEILEGQTVARRLKNFLGRLHEACHGAAGDCPGTGAHYRDPHMSDCLACVACEVDAWRLAMSFVPFTRAMFAEVQRCLGTYRHTTAGVPAALAALDEFVSFRTWATHVQQRAEMQLKRDWLERVKRELDPQPRHSGQLVTLQQRLDAAMGANR